MLIEIVDRDRWKQIIDTAAEIYEAGVQGSYEERLAAYNARNWLYKRSHYPPAKDSPSSHRTRNRLELIQRVLMHVDGRVFLEAEEAIAIMEWAGTI